MHDSHQSPFLFLFYEIKLDMIEIKKTRLFYGANMFTDRNYTIAPIIRSKYAIHMLIVNELVYISSIR